MNRREGGRWGFHCDALLLLLHSLPTLPLTLWGKQWAPHSSHFLEEATSTPLSRRVTVEGHVASPCPATHLWEDRVVCVHVCRTEFHGPCLPSLQAARANSWEAYGLQWDWQDWSTTGVGKGGAERSQECS